MLEFDLQRFVDNDDTMSEPESEQDTGAQSEDNKPIPEELNGLPEEYAREALKEWEETQPEQEPPQPSAPKTEESVPYARFKEKVDEANQLKAQLEEYRRNAQGQQAPQQPQQQPKEQQFQPAQLKITPEIAEQINKAITAEAMQIANMSEDDVESLEYADDDDPRLAQWSQAKSFATNKVYGALQQIQAQQQYQAQQFYAAHTAAINTYNEFAQKEFAEPDFQAIQQFATNEFFNQLKPDEQRIIANSYLRIERQTASPAEMMVVKNYYERAKAAYRSRGGKQRRTTNTAPQLPRTNQLKGTSSMSDGQLTEHDLEKLLERDFTTLTKKEQDTALGFI